jgi:hypothetical protein
MKVSLRENKRVCFINLLRLFPARSAPYRLLISIVKAQTHSDV